MLIVIEYIDQYGFGYGEIVSVAYFKENNKAWEYRDKRVKMVESGELSPHHKFTIRNASDGDLLV